jgi:hypothetical protein
MLRINEMRDIKSGILKLPDKPSAFLNDWFGKTTGR